jgi:hypothetical protein
LERNGVRFSFLIMAVALVAGCGQSRSSAGDAAAGNSAGGNSAGVTVPLPPPLPVGQAPKATPGRPEPKADPAAPPAEPMNLVPAAPPIGQDRLAGYIGRAGFECDRVVTVSQMRGAGGRRAGIYKFDCATGGSYQGTMRNNHLYFRPWTGAPSAR